MNKEILKKLGFEKEVSNIEKGLCPLCSKKILLENFRDNVSLKEYTISGVCQECQDKAF